MNYMNAKHPNIKFTSEFEINDSFSFLDIKIKCSNNQLVTSIYCKVRPKKSSLVSGKRPDENFFIIYQPALSTVYQNIDF